MTVLEELFPGSFRGVSFLIKRATTTGGRRVVSHEFVNSNFREVEDLGENLKRFSITAIIASETEDQETHLSKKVSFMNALDEEGSGKLVHPFYGEYTVKSGEYSVIDDVTKLGETTFQLSFEIETSLEILDIVSESIDEIQSKSESVKKRLSLDIAKEYFNSGIDAINATTDFIGDLSSKVESITNLYSEAFFTVSDLVASVQGLKNNVNNVLNLPNQMSKDIGVISGRIEAIFESKKNSFTRSSPNMTQEQQNLLGNTDDVARDIDNTFEDERSIEEGEEKSKLDKTDSDYIRDKFLAYIALIDFNINSPRILEITSASTLDLNGNDIGATASVSVDIGNDITSTQAEIITNEKLLTLSVRIGSLVDAYNSASEIEFSSIDEIEQFQSELELQYQSLIADSTINHHTVKELKDLRDIVEKYFFTKKLTTNQIIEIETNNIPVQVLSYILYGSQDVTNELVSLNNEINVSDISGTVRVYTR